MDIRDSGIEIALIVVLIISAQLLLQRSWSDSTVVIGGTLMMLSLGGLFLSLKWKIHQLEKTLAHQQRLTRLDLEDISAKMAERYDSTITHVEDVLTEMTKRVYR